MVDDECRSPAFHRRHDSCKHAHTLFIWLIFCEVGVFVLKSYFPIISSVIPCMWWVQEGVCDCVCICAFKSRWKLKYTTPQEDSESQHYWMPSPPHTQKVRRAPREARPNLPDYILSIHTETHKSLASLWSLSGRQQC